MQTLDLKNIDLDNTIFVDTRSHGYYLISHVADSINIESAKRIGYIAKENPTKIIALYCHTGIGAGQIADELIAEGHQNIRVIAENFFHLHKYGLNIVGEGAKDDS